jgi:hypothetical protein
MRRFAPQADGFKQTEIGPVPEEWEVVRVADRYRFTTKPRSMRIDQFEAIPFVPMDRIPIGKLYFREFVLKHPREISSGTTSNPMTFLCPKLHLHLRTANRE